MLCYCNYHVATFSLAFMWSHVNNWCQKNQLSIHSGKSDVLIMTAQEFVRSLKTVMTGKDIIEYVQISNCLGVTVDNHLNWSLHIDGVSKLFKGKVIQFRRMSYLPATVREEIYFKTIISAVAYGMAVWGTCSPALMTEIEKTQVRAARLIHNLPSNIGNENVLATVSGDPLDYIYKRKILTPVHKSYHGDEGPAKSQCHQERKKVCKK